EWRGINSRKSGSPRSPNLKAALGGDLPGTKVNYNACGHKVWSTMPRRCLLLARPFDPAVAVSPDLRRKTRAVPAAVARRSRRADERREVVLNPHATGLRRAIGAY